ncbi:hypothetical protein GCM10010359_65430 [Streptomyces morookaense]|nr:hypothetical protein GCM10010359_65430 [Streptomyces morookaense]
MTTPESTGRQGRAPEAGAPPQEPPTLTAEPANTPPPPPAAFRPAGKRPRIWAASALLLLLVALAVQALRPLPAPTLSLSADATYTFEGSSPSLPWPTEGQGWMSVAGLGTMDRFGEQNPVPIGSVAKAMTAYVILREHPLQPGADGPSVTVDAKAQKEGGYDAAGESTLNTVKENDRLSLKDALSALMIPSANNIARLLARWDSGSEEAFAGKMNAAARRLGMDRTTYTDPSGLKETTVSTAEDQVKLGNELVKIKALTDITRLPQWKDPSGRTWRNFNSLVPFDNAIGIKTGSTTKAGGNLLFAATRKTGRQTVTVVGAILGQHRAPVIDTVNAVSKKVMAAARNALQERALMDKGTVVGHVDDGLGGRTPVVTSEPVSVVGWTGLTAKLKLGNGGTAIPHTAPAGKRVGVLSIGDGTGSAVEVPVELRRDLGQPGTAARLTRLG